MEGKNSFNDKNLTSSKAPVVWAYRANKDGIIPGKDRKSSAAVSPLLTKFSSSASSYAEQLSISNSEQIDESASITFSVDKDMYQKLNLKKPVSL